MNVSRESLQLLRNSFLTVREDRILGVHDVSASKQPEAFENDNSYLVLAEDLRRAKNYVDDFDPEKNSKRAAEATKAMEKLEKWVIRFLKDTEEITTLNLEKLPSYITFSFGMFGISLERILEQLEKFYSKNLRV